MADMPNDFWSGWIIVVTLISFIGLVWLVVSVYTAAPPDPEEVEHTTWDENLQEGTNPAPLWWFWMIFSMMVFSVFYLMFYPGMGSFKGAFQWSQGGRLEERIDDFDDQFAEMRADIAVMPLEEIQEDDALMNSAADLFAQNCSACHGYEAQGQANLFPNLADEIWQWGGAPENIEQTIRVGRTAVMASWEALLGQEGITNVANYVLLTLKGIRGRRSLTRCVQHAIRLQVQETPCLEHLISPMMTGCMVLTLTLSGLPSVRAEMVRCQPLKTSLIIHRSGCVLPG